MRHLHPWDRGSRHRGIKAGSTDPRAKEGGSETALRPLRVEPRPLAPTLRRTEASSTGSRGKVSFSAGPGTGPVTAGGRQHQAGPRPRDPRSPPCRGGWVNSPPTFARTPTRGTKAAGTVSGTGTLSRTLGKSGSTWQN